MKKFIQKFNRRQSLFALGVLSLIVLTVFLINPFGLVAGGLGLAAVPIWGAIKDNTFKELSPEEISKLEEDQQVLYFTELKAYKDAERKALIEKLKKENTEELNKEIQKVREELIEANLKWQESVQKTMKTQGKALSTLLQKGLPEDGPKTLKSELEEKKEQIKELFVTKGKTVELKALTNRASLTNGTQDFFLPDIGQLATAERRAMNVFPQFNITDQEVQNGNIRYIDWDQATSVRAAEMVAEGGTFPESTAKWQEYNLPIRKIGDTMIWSEEFAEDMPLLARELQPFLQTNVEIKENDQVVNGDGTGQNLTGLFTSIPAYTPVASGNTDASIYDLVVKLREAIEGPYGGKYRVDVVFMNIVDINKYKLKKDANNNYILPPFYDRDGNRIDGVTVIEDNVVTANTLAIGDRRFGRVYNRTGYEISNGYQGDQFVEDKMTMKIRRRKLFLIRTVDKTGFLKVTDIDAALTTLAS